MNQRRITAAAVFCGANDGRQASYRAEAETLGRHLAENSIHLVYGGSSCGLMGAVANAALATGGRVTGVIPKALANHEIAHTGLERLELVDGMHERKALMASLVDVFIALPGGFGTLDESFEALTWTQLGLQQKPLGLLNVDGYYDQLLAFADHQVKEGFVKPVHRALLVDAPASRSLLEKLSRVDVVDSGKWDA